MTLWMDAAFLGTLAAPAGYVMTDPDAAAYVTDVETADGQPLESTVRQAIDTLYLGIKADGDFALLQSILCLCVPRTLNGNLVAMKGANIAGWTNFSSGDIQRGRGMIGNAVDKYGLTGTNMNSYGSTTSGLVMMHLFDITLLGVGQTWLGTGTVTAGSRTTFSKGSGNSSGGRIWQDPFVGATIGPIPLLSDGEAILSATGTSNTVIRFAVHTATPASANSTHPASTTVTSGNHSLFINNTTIPAATSDRIAMVFLGTTSDTAVAGRLAARSLAFTNSLRAFFGN